jgi:ADP-ribose pyrophosphatase
MAPEGEDGWLIVESQIVIETPHLRLRRDEIELPSGKRIGSYYVRESRGFAVVFAITPEERIVLVRQYKHGVARVVLELPAGGLDENEDAEACARRELAEETGYVADAPTLEHAGTFLYDPTSSTTRYHLFLARDVTKRVPTAFDETEQIDVQLATFDELRAFVRDGRIDVGAHVASVYYMLDRLGKL